MGDLENGVFVKNLKNAGFVKYGSINYQICPICTLFAKNRHNLSHKKCANSTLLMADRVPDGLK
jgi:hypothetical protein